MAAAVQKVSTKDSDITANFLFFYLTCRAKSMLLHFGIFMKYKYIIFEYVPKTHTSINGLFTYLIIFPDLISVSSPL